MNPVQVSTSLAILLLAFAGCGSSGSGTPQEDLAGLDAVDGNDSATFDPGAADVAVLDAPQGDPAAPDGDDGAIVDPDSADSVNLDAPPDLPRPPDVPLEPDVPTDVPADAVDLPGDSLCEASDCGTDSTPPMIPVPGGTFLQGNESKDWDTAATPPHEVTVATFWIDQYEVTMDSYAACVADGGCKTPYTNVVGCNWGKAGRGAHPVNCIPWGHAREYCAWAGKRLCSESEWEMAARGTDGRDYPWGNETATCGYAVMATAKPGCGTGLTWPVGSKPAGASTGGALDMSGNVYEWVEDDWHDDYTGAPTDGSAWTENPRAPHRVMRGGGFHMESAGAFRSWVRYFINDGDAYIVQVGARCCKSL